MPRKNRPPPISSIDYDEKTQELRVGFADGSDYNYDNVPEHVVAEFRSAASKGTYFNANIRNEY